MYFRPGKFTYSLIVWSLLSLLWMSGFHPYAWLTVLLAGLGLFFQERIQLSFKGQAAIALGALILCFTSTRTLDHTEVGRFLGIGTMSLAILGATLLSCLLVLKREGPTVRGLLLCASGTLIACSMSSDLLSVGCITGVGLLLTILAYREAQGLRSSWRLVPPVLITFCLVTSLSVLATWSESRLSYLASLFQLTPPAGFSFPVATSLRALQRHNGSDVVVLRGYGPNPPMYLVGRSFTEFDNNSFWRWKTTKTSLSPEDQILVETPEGLKALSLFSKNSEEGSEAGHVFRMEYPKSGRGYTLYAPRQLYGVAADISKLNRYGDGMLQVESKETLNGNYYLVAFPQGWQTGTTQAETDEELLEQCLLLPEDVTPEVSRLAEEIAGQVDDPAKKAAFITAYLQQNFTYGYDYPFESTKTALEEFLLKRPPAHCEFFATAGALMMRSQGVPTRYINGFVLQEKALNGNYYVVRLKHAHAWVEAYIPGQGWTTFDPTPPGTLESPESQASLGSSLLELFSNLWRKFVGFFELSPQEMWERLKALAQGMSKWDYAKLLALGALWFLWNKYRRREPKVAAPQMYRYEVGRHATLTPLLEEFMESIQPPAWQREEAETLQQWLERLKESNLPIELHRELSEFVQLFTEARYGSSGSELGEKELRKSFQTLLSSLKGTSLTPREPL